MNWVAVAQLNLGYYIGGTMLSTTYTHHGIFIKVLQSNPVNPGH